MAVIKQHMQTASAMLKEAGVESSVLDARLLMSHLLSLSHEQLLLRLNEMLQEEDKNTYFQYIDRRCEREPLAKIIGKKAFWKHDFETNEHTLDPRPDSESLIELVLEQMPDVQASYKIVDFGVGTGCLLLSLLHEYKNASGLGVDVSRETFKVVEKNALSLGVIHRIQCLESNWGEEISGNSSVKYDIIVSNPPYIPTNDIMQLEKEVSKYDPMQALDGGEDGYDDYRSLAPYCAELLAHEGKVFFEIGLGQEKTVEAIMAQHGFYLCASKKDLAGIIRALAFAR